MFAEDCLSSFDVLLITYDTSLGISAQQAAHSFVVLAFLQHIQRVSTFAIVWRFFVL